MANLFIDIAVIIYILALFIKTLIYLLLDALLIILIISLIYYCVAKL